MRAQLQCSSSGVTHAAPRALPLHLRRVAGSSNAALPARSLRATASSAGAAAPLTAGDRSHETDVVIIGSGIGGLCCGALLAKYGLDVSLCFGGGDAIGSQLLLPGLAAPSNRSLQRTSIRLPLPTGDCLRVPQHPWRRRTQLGAWSAARWLGSVPVPLRSCWQRRRCVPCSKQAVHS